MRDRPLRMRSSCEEQEHQALAQMQGCKRLALCGGRHNVVLCGQGQMSLTEKNTGVHSSEPLQPLGHLSTVCTGLLAVVASYTPSGNRDTPSKIISYSRGYKLVKAAHRLQS